MDKTDHKVTKIWKKLWLTNKRYHFWKKNDKFRKISIFTLNCELRYAILQTVPECYKLQLSRLMYTPMPIIVTTYTMLLTATVLFRILIKSQDCELRYSELRYDRFTLYCKIILKGGKITMNLYSLTSLNIHALVERKFTCGNHFDYYSCVRNRQKCDYAYLWLKKTFWFLMMLLEFYIENEE